MRTSNIERLYEVNKLLKRIQGLLKVIRLRNPVQKKGIEKELDEAYKTIKDIISMLNKLSLQLYGVKRYPNED